jgi:hypothetical protein
MSEFRGNVFAEISVTRSVSWFSHRFRFEEANVSDTIVELDGLIADLEVEVVATGGGDGDGHKSELCSIGCSAVC